VSVDEGVDVAVSELEADVVLVAVPVAVRLCTENRTLRQTHAHEQGSRAPQRLVTGSVLAPPGTRLAVSCPNEH